MRRLWGILFAALISTGAHAQSTARVGYAADGNGSQPFTYVSSGTPLPVTGSFSAGSFAPGGSFANLTSTASSADAALPTGTTVALFNTGTTAVSCTLTVGAGSSTANKNIIQASSWFAVSVGSNTHYSCINQAGDGASNVVVASGGSGLPAGAGGGGGGSSSNASVGSTGSAVPSSATYVGITSGGNLTGWDGSINLTKMGGTSINSGCVGALSGFSAAVPSTVCGVFGMYVLNPTPLSYQTIANVTSVGIALDQVNQTTGNIAANNTTAVVVNAAATTLYGVQLYGIGSAPAYLKLYNATSATCGSGTPVKRLMIPAASTAANGAGSNVTFPIGLRFSTGLTYCVTTGITDADTTAPAASTFLVNLDWH